MFCKKYGNNLYRLKKTAFDSFDLPVVVTHGFVGKLKIVIPWTSLDTQPVTLEISDVYFVVVPKKNVTVRICLHIYYI